ncbi:hypothetical protein DFH28DRAFT_1127569 [Melampsora americana]|nr:hypothetical protein DFH28DRAFT_1127569 [Melampsora americana]
MTNIDGEKKTVVRKDGFFYCPQGACGYKSDVPKYFGVHLAACKVAVQHIQPPAPKQNAVRVVPLGEDIIASDALGAAGLKWPLIGTVTSRVFMFIKSRSWKTWRRTLRWRSQPIAPVLPPGYEPGKPCEPIQGLKIYDGFGCRLCHRAYPKMKSIKQHFRLNHNEAYKAQDVVQHIFATKCQRLYSHNLRYYFAVLPNLSRPRQVLPGHDRSPSPELEHSDAVKALEKDSHLSNWLYVSGIHHYIADLIQRGRTYNNEEIAPDRRCGRQQRASCPYRNSRQVDKYANTLARLMWFMIEESEKKVDSNTQFYNIHVAMLSDLKAAIESITVNLRQPDEDNNRLRDPEIHDPISGRVSKILCALFQLYCSAAHCQYWLPALQFLARAMLKADKSYDRPDNFHPSHCSHSIRCANGFRSTVHG